jgi:hypothetical protein
MRAFTGVLALAAIVAVSALLIPTALGSTVGLAPYAPPAQSTALAAVPLPATTLKLNSTGTAGYEGGLSPNGSVTAFNTSWIEPHVNCTTKNTSVLFDAFASGSSIAAIGGTAVNCTAGVLSAFAFYVFSYSNGTSIVTKVPTATIPVSPGAIVKVTITHKSGSLKIVVAVGSHSVTKARPSTSRLSIVALGVTGFGVLHGKIAPLANFGTVAFGKSFTHVAGTNVAKINGTSKGMGAYPYLFEFTLVDAKSKVLSVPTAMSAAGTSFKVTWKAST